MSVFVVTLHVLTCLALIVLVLLQQGKGADAGMTLAGGGSQSVFGSQGPASFLVKLTVILAVLFFGTSWWLGHASSTTNVAEGLAHRLTTSPTSPRHASHQGVATTKKTTNRVEQQGHPHPIA